MVCTEAERIKGVRMTKENTRRAKYGQIEWHNTKTEKPVMRGWDGTLYSDHLLLTVKYERYEQYPRRRVIIGQLIEEEIDVFWRTSAGSRVTGEVIAWAYMPGPCTM